MKLLIIICSHNLDLKWSNNIQILNDYMKLQDMEVDYCGISNQDDFHNYENIISFKYKIVNTQLQFSKICDFITDYKPNLDYDWYMKFRPDLKLLENINFNILSINAINARARVYFGPRKIKYGMSINGEGCWKNAGDCFYAVNEHSIILDDMLFIFHKNILQTNTFNKIEQVFERENEWFQTNIFNKHKVNLNVIGLNLINSKYMGFSGNTNDSVLLSDSQNLIKDDQQNIETPTLHNARVKALSNIGIKKRVIKHKLSKCHFF